MVETLLWWGGAVNVALLTRVLWRAPEAIRLHAEATHLSNQAGLLWAQIEQTKLEKGFCDEQRARDMRACHEAMLELEKLKRNPQPEQPCDSVASSS